MGEYRAGRDVGRLQEKVHALETRLEGFMNTFNDVVQKYNEKQEATNQHFAAIDAEIVQINEKLGGIQEQLNEALASGGTAAERQELVDRITADIAGVQAHTQKIMDIIPDEEPPIEPVEEPSVD